MPAEQGPTILIVEDEAAVAQLQQRHLARAGYQVTVVDCAAAALRTLAEHRFDVLLLDYRLPDGVDGLRLVELMQQAGHDSPVILVTGFSTESTIIQALRAGVRDVVPKSVGYLDYLPEAVARVLKQVRVEQQLAESEARLSSIINSARDAILVADARQRITLFNAAAEKMFRCAAAAALGQPITRFIPRETPSAHGAVSPTSPTLHLRSGTRGVRADGEVFPLESTISPVTTAGGKFYTVVVRDISERVRAEQALLASEVMYRKLVDTTPDAIVVTDLQANIIKVNRQAVQTFGCASAEELLGKNGFDLIAPEDHFLAAQSMERLRATRSRQHVELTLLGKEGRRFPAETNSALIADSDGQPHAILVLVRDVSARKEADRALLKEQQFTRAVLDHVRAGIIACDAQGKLSLFNRVAVEIHGQPVQPVPPQSWPQQYHLYRTDGKTPMAWEELPLFRALQGEVVKNVELMILPDAAPPRTVLVSGEAITDSAGRKLGAVVVVHDITEQKQAMAHISELANILEKAQDAIVVLDLEDRITFWNEGATRLYEWTAAEARSRPAMPLLFPKGSRFLFEAQQVVVAVGEWIGELEPSSKAGKPLVVASHWTLLRNAQGQPRGKLLINTDITEKKKLENQLLHAQRMESIGRLAGGVAHDFNNLLTIITGYCDLLLLRRQPGDPALAPLHEIRKAGERAASLTRQLLAFSRKQILHAQVVDLNQLIRESEKMLRRLIGEDIDFATALDPALGTIRADPAQLEQVLMNLIVNARDAMPTGGHLTVETHNVQLGEAEAASRQGLRPGPFVLLAITDTGHGMTEEVKSRVFEPFFTTKEPGHGTGLGLAMVFGVVKQSAGHIEVYSEPGHGTTFRIYLPRLDPGATPSVAPAETARQLSGTETVLLTEDEDGVRLLARLALQAHGFTVLEAHDGEQAVAIGRRYSPPIHLLVTDVVMPKMSGRVLAERLQESRPDIKVLYISGYTDDAIFRHGVLESGTPFLQKPFTPTTLVRKVREVLDS